MAGLALQVAAVLLCITVHELSHGLAAYLMGDPTAKDRRRLSLNPLRHIDPLGALMMLTAGFGWAKPVPVDMRYFKNPRAGMAITSLAGPLSNFLLAYVAYMAAFVVLGAAAVSGQWGRAAAGAVDFCTMLAGLSIGLGIFNLIPFPPLDGSKVVGAFLPPAIYFKILRYEFYGMFVLIFVLWQGWLDGPLNAALSGTARLLLQLAQWPYELLLLFA